MMPMRSQCKDEAEWLEHLRLWFAGLALAGLVQDRETQRMLRERHEDKALYELMAEATYKLADAMLEVRKR